MPRLAVFAVFLVAFPGIVVAEVVGECYSCTYDQQDGSTDKDCVASPAPDASPDASPDVNTTLGNSTQCRQCYTERKLNLATNIVVSVTRGCDTNGTKTTECTSDYTFATSTTTCDSGLCNGQNESTVPNEYVMCYSCVYSNNGVNDNCVKHPELHTSIPCYYPRTCYTKGLWSPQANSMWSFSRGCDDFSREKKDCVKPDGGYDTCLDVCCEDNCNVGNGRTYGNRPSCRNRPAPYRFSCPSSQTTTTTRRPDPSSATSPPRAHRLLLLLLVLIAMAGCFSCARM